MSKPFSFVLFLLFTSFFSVNIHAQRTHNDIKWTELPPLPPAPGETVQPGLAGAFAGKHNNVLLLAGGSNFPVGKPWGHEQQRLSRQCFAAFMEPNSK